MLRRSKIVQLGLVTLLALPQTAVASDKAGAPKKGLDADTVQQIQAIGQSVLSAKRNAPVNPDMDQLRQHVDELRLTVSKLRGQALLPVNGAAISISGVATDAETALNPEGKRIRREHDQAEKDVRNVLERVRQKRTAAQRNRQGKEHEERHHRDKIALAKVQQLEDELEKALQSPANEREATLRELEERLKIKPHSPIEQKGEQTPTISTITHHRDK